jgi:hypothetical protein
VGSIIQAPDHSTVSLSVNVCNIFEKQEGLSGKVVATKRILNNCNTGVLATASDFMGDNNTIEILLLTTYHLQIGQSTTQQCL